MGAWFQQSLELFLVRVSVCGQLHCILAGPYPLPPPEVSWTFPTESLCWILSMTKVISISPPPPPLLIHMNGLSSHRDLRRNNSEKMCDVRTANNKQEFADLVDPSLISSDYIAFLLLCLKVMPNCSKHFSSSLAQVKQVSWGDSSVTLYYIFCLHIFKDLLHFLNKI